MDLITTETNVDYLITALRLHIDDDSTPYTYSDDVLRTYLINSIKALMPRWNSKYLLTTGYDVVRNPHHTYLFSSPPILQQVDERAVVLQAAILIKSPLVYTNSQSVLTWKDEEISYSNVSGNQAVAQSLARDIAELEMILPPARKRLAQAKKQSLPGFEYPPNEYEG